MLPEDRLKRIANRSNELIGEKTRLAIMIYLSLNGKATFKRVQDGLGLTSGNLASHLEKLEGGGYIEVRRSLLDARQRVIKPTPIGLAALAEFTTSNSEALKKGENNDKNEPT